MNRIAKLVGVAGSFLGTALVIESKGQTFVNLDFESANLPSLPSGQSGGLVSANNALPGWQVFFGTNSSPVSTVLHNNYNLGTINASILGPTFNGGPFGVSVIDGNFMPYLQAGFTGSSDLATKSVAIAQSGMVPAFAESLQFKVGLDNQIGFGFNTNFSISLNGQTRSLVPLGAGANFALYGVDVGGLAGQLAELRVTSFVTPTRPAANLLAIDSFVFSPDPVPEPSTWALLALGGAAGWWGLRRRKA